MKRWLLSSGCSDHSGSLALLLVRLGFGGMMFFGHGLDKLNDALNDWSGFVDGFSSVIINSTVSALGAIASETLFAAMIVLGIGTRLASIPLVFTMAVAAFMIHGDAALFMGDGPSKEPALIYMVAFLAVLIGGAGKYSIDAKLR